MKNLSLNLILLPNENINEENPNKYYAILTQENDEGLNPGIDSSLVLRQMQEIMKKYPVVTSTNNKKDTFKFNLNVIPELVQNYYDKLFDCNADVIIDLNKRAFTKLKIPKYEKYIEFVFLNFDNSHELYQTVKKGLCITSDERYCNTQQLLSETERNIYRIDFIEPFIESILKEYNTINNIYNLIDINNMIHTHLLGNYVLRFTSRMIIANDTPMITPRNEDNIPSFTRADGILFNLIVLILYYDPVLLEEFNTLINDKLSTMGLGKILYDSVAEQFKNYNFSQVAIDINSCKYSLMTDSFYRALLLFRNALRRCLSEDQNEITISPELKYLLLDLNINDSDFDDVIKRIAPKIFNHCKAFMTDRAEQHDNYKHLKRDPKNPTLFVGPYPTQTFLYSETITTNECKNRHYVELI